MYLRKFFAPPFKGRRLFPQRAAISARFSNRNCRALFSWRAGTLRLVRQGESTMSPATGAIRVEKNDLAAGGRLKISDDLLEKPECFS